MVKCWSLQVLHIFFSVFILSFVSWNMLFYFTKNYFQSLIIWLERFNKFIKIKSISKLFSCFWYIFGLSAFDAFTFYDPITIYTACFWEKSWSLTSITPTHSEHLSAATPPIQVALEGSPSRGANSRIKNSVQVLMALRQRPLMAMSASGETVFNYPHRTWALVEAAPLYYCPTFIYAFHLLISSLKCSEISE